MNTKRYDAAVTSVLKRTTSRAYYKVFSYLHDFRSLWLASQPMPRSILLVPEGVQRRLTNDFSETAIVSGNDRVSLAEALSAGLLR